MIQNGLTKTPAKCYYLNVGFASNVYECTETRNAAAIGHWKRDDAKESARPPLSERD
jgi:hypothetical protein